ncbi:MAG: hypothetical protein Q8R24_04925 [Legionellaceae bacterium]|nr:hypothetical protein [Legionellaceae bacterium]
MFFRNNETQNARVDTQTTGQRTTNTNVADPTRSEDTCASQLRLHCLIRFAFGITGACLILSATKNIENDWLRLFFVAFGSSSSAFLPKLIYENMCKQQRHDRIAPGQSPPALDLTTENMELGHGPA